MTSCKAAMDAYELIRRLLDKGIRPHAVSIAAHYGITPQQLKVLTGRAGLLLPAGRMSAAQIAAFEAACPHIELKLPRLDAGAIPARNLPLDGAPPELELEDSCAQWGIKGAAEEYEVSEDQICAWLRAYGMRGEISTTMWRRPPGGQEVTR